MEEYFTWALGQMWGAFALPALLLVGASELGFRLGRRVDHRLDEAHRSTIGGVQGAILGLLGLLLGFTFAMATARHDERRVLVIEEANAIGTAYLRASLLPAPHAQATKDLLRRYLDVRIDYGPVADEPAKLAEGLRKNDALQSELWSHAVAAAAARPDAIVATFVNALNQVFDVHTSRLAAGRTRIPLTIWGLLLVVGGLGCLTSSYLAGVNGDRSLFSSIVLPLLVSVVVLLIFDIMQPRQGWISVSQESLLDLKQSLSAAP